MPRRRTLPNLHDLTAFEAAAHALNFTQAAQDLNVQQPAVSRRVGQLEAWIGVRLFNRHGSRLSLTAQGQRLFEATRGALNDVEAALRDIQPGAAHPALRVGASIAFASLWLIPRLDRFRRAHPDIEVSIVTRSSNAMSAADTADVTVYFRDDSVPDDSGTPIFFEHLIVACSAGYQDRQPAPITLDTLFDHPILVMDDPPHREDWRRVLEPLGLRPPPPRPEHTFVNFVVYLNAVLSGAGIGLVWRDLALEHLRSGVLLRPFEVDHRSERGYRLHCGPDVAQDDDARAFITWMQAEAAADAITA